jgi:hypothetical protein
MVKKFILYISHLMKSELFNFNRAQVNNTKPHNNEKVSIPF